MYEHFFANPGTLLMGALTGLIFGFLLQKAHVTRFSVIAGQFLLKDFTVLKVMLTAVVVGAIGIYGMLLLGLLEPGQMHIKNATLLGNAVGGVIFGIGMAVLGYCPGTGVAAIGDGSRHAIAGLIGMLAGAGVYAEVYPSMKSSILGVGEFGEATLATATHLSPWWFIAALAVIAVVLFLILERAETRRAAAG
ncbi:MAG: YeeE/YedE thiosulfate transporter family protein [Planctomycetota bacterium]|nr:YeeE/YedE thiosulfate transporter family protein [Planctomycetota bacterium]